MITQVLLDHDDDLKRLLIKVMDEDTLATRALRVSWEYVTGWEVGVETLRPELHHLEKKKTHCGHCAHRVREGHPQAVGHLKHGFDLLL